MHLTRLNIKYAIFYLYIRIKEIKWLFFSLTFVCVLLYNRFEVGNRQNHLKVLCVLNFTYFKFKFKVYLF